MGSYGTEGGPPPEPVPTWYCTGLFSCLCAGLRRLRDHWAKALDSVRDGSGSQSYKTRKEEAWRGWLKPGLSQM